MSPSAVPARRHARPPAILLALGLTVALALVGVPAAGADRGPVMGSPRSTAPPSAAEVVVRADSAARAAQAVRDVGGTVHRALDIIDGVDASVPADELAGLAADAAVLSVTPDARVMMLDDDREVRPGAGVAMGDVITAIEADELWARGITGDGVGIALIDTGVVPVEGLDDEGQLTFGPDLSFESQQDGTRHLDTFGHGTHMASIIMGRDDAETPGSDDDDDDEDEDDDEDDEDDDDDERDLPRFSGVAPDAHLISLKVADAQGATDVSQVIAAIDWVVQHRDDPGLNIRVLNLSFGVHSLQGYAVDPVAHAAQVAWDAGIVVVTAAGNDGDLRSGLTSPAYHPRLIAVGAVDTNGSDRRRDWTPLSFSARAEPGERAPDLLAPGASIVGLAAPGSFLDHEHGHTARVGDRFFKGTGTSQAAAVTSGAIALLLQANPGWTPDQVKAALLRTAPALKARKGFTAETGTLALQLRGTADATPRPQHLQRVTASTGGGSLDAARGEHHLDVDGVPLAGEVDIFGQPVDTVALARTQEAHATWVDGTWNGTRWTGAEWNGDQWSGTRWNGTQWNGTQWTGTRWTGTTWAGTQWNGTRWSGTRWSGTRWTGTRWTGTQWTGSQWNGTQWRGTQWSGTVWG